MSSRPSDEVNSSVSYNHWVGKSADPSQSSAAPRPEPKKLTAEDVAALPKSSSQGSLWNEAGTWEEKALTDWAKERIKDVLSLKETVKLNGASEKFDVSVRSCSGDATILIVRNKRRHGYTFELVLSFKGTCGRSFNQSQEVSGIITIAEVSMGELDDLEMEVKVTEKSSLSPDKVKSVVKAVKSLAPAIREKLQQFEAEFKQR